MMMVTQNIKHFQMVLIFSEDRSEGNGGSGRPAYGCQVTIHSEHEKQLKKQLRRDEKKIDRWKGKEEESDAGFNPQELRANR